MKNFKVKPLNAIISGLVMAAATQSAFAQNADATQKQDDVVDEIVVTGFAKSIATALETKRKADTVIEAISAEDIGGLNL
jgi:iron complex outermembrane recepter protein